MRLEVIYTLINLELEALSKRAHLNTFEIRMKQNVKNIRNKRYSANLLSGNEDGGEEAQYFVSANNHITANNNELFCLKVTKMKRSSNKDAKLGEKCLKHITLKSIRVSFANLFKPSKRIGRNQQNLFDEELKDFTQKYAGFNHVHTPTPIAAMNFATPAQLISLTQPQFNAIDTNNFMEAGEKKSLRRQSNILVKPLTTRSTTFTNICTAVAVSDANNSDNKSKQLARKAQPSMGVRAIAVKSSKTKPIKPIAPQLPNNYRKLVPFLDSIETLLPISSSTFIERKKSRLSVESDHTQAMSTSSSLSCVCSGSHSSKNSSGTLSPISIKSTRKQCIQVRSISVMNVSSIISNRIQF